MFATASKNFIRPEKGIQETPLSVRKIDSVNRTLLHFLVSKHLEVFHDSLSAQLGRSYLEFFYRKMILDSRSLLLGYFGENGECFGFIGGTLESSTFYDKRHKTKIILNLLYSLVRTHLSFQNVIRLVLKYIKFRKCQVDAELLSLLVVSEMRKKGIGRSLVISLCSYFDQNRKENWKVSTEVDSAHRFYSKLKMKKFEEFEFAGTKSSLFVGKVKAYLPISPLV